MLITTQDQFSDYNISKTLGIVKGNTIRARHVGKDIMAGMLAESREQAYDRMVAQAEELGADAIVCLRYTTSSVMAGSAELLAYGTAVKLIKK
jgi:uncharacterized protein YbjQ (UPF0145 family)